MTPGLLKVEQPCPQCGAPVLLEESDRLFACGHCRVRLYLSGGTLPRYFLPPKEGGDLLFVPYWHFRGAWFAVFRGDIATRFFDKTLRASGPEKLPLTLGVRPQAMTLRRAARGVKGRFLRPLMSGDAALQKAEALSRSFGGLQGTIVHSAFSGEARSIIYAPYHEREHALWDAVLGRRQVAVPGDLSEQSPPEDTSSWQTTFMPALCPECGWDLPGERRSVVLHCRGCSRSWESEKGRWEGVRHDFAPGTGGSYFPFWELRVRVEGVRPEHSQGLPAPTRKAWEDGALLVRVPAFGVRPRVLMRLSGQLTALPPEPGDGRETPEGVIVPVTLEKREALAMTEVVLAMLVVPKRDAYALLPNLRPRLEAARILFLPFRESGGDFVQAERKISFRKNTRRG
jgi:ribosomal protein S27AE